MWQRAITFYFQSSPIGFYNRSMTNTKKTSKLFAPHLIILLCVFCFNTAHSSPESNKIIIAQADETDAYDPFADYSDFSESEDEEADINFFRNGRFYTIGAMLGNTQYTGSYGDYMSSGLNFGIFLSYFFDLRFALQFSFLSSAHTFKLTTPAANVIRQNTKLSSLNIDLKYYFNTQNVTKGLARLSPYAIFGYTQVSQAAIIDIRTAKTSSSGFTLGGGLEVPIMRNAMYLGAQLTYQPVQFSGEGQEVVYSGNGVENTGIFLNGDLLNLQMVMGINF